MGSVTYNIPSGPTVLPKAIELNVVNKVAVGDGGDLGAALAVPMLATLAGVLFGLGFVAAGVELWRRPA